MGTLEIEKCKFGLTCRLPLLGAGMSNHVTYCSFPSYCKSSKSLSKEKLYSIFN